MDKGSSGLQIALANILGPPGSSARQQKIVLASVTLGLALIGFFTRYLRSRSKPSKAQRRRFKAREITSSPEPLNRRSPSFENISASVLDQHRRSSTSSARTASTLMSNSILENGNGILNSTQLGVMGIESLEKSIHLWEDSLIMLRSSNSENLIEEGQSNPERTLSLLEKILDNAYKLQSTAEELYLNETSSLYGEPERRYRLTSVSSVESFMSAEDFLSDDEEIRNSLKEPLSQSEKYPLYEAAFRLVEAGSVPYRTYKTEMVGCSEDKEYLAKLHCVRAAFSKILSDSEKRKWISNKGKEVFANMLVYADKDPTGFEGSLDNFIKWAEDPENWSMTEAELKDRGLRAMTFYDIVLDFILLDAFEDLEAPPPSVLAVTQNRWLSNSFKETALGTAVWSVLKAKRRWLRFSDGFIGHFYDLSEHIMPSLAWGFLGPETDFQDLCNFFKDKFLEFLNCIFSFEKVRYTSLDALVHDVMIRMEDMYLAITRRLDLS